MWKDQLVMEITPVTWPPSLSVGERTAKGMVGSEPVSFPDQAFSTCIAKSDLYWGWWSGTESIDCVDQQGGLIWGGV